MQLNGLFLMISILAMFWRSDFIPISFNDKKIS